MQSASRTSPRVKARMRLVAAAKKATPAGESIEPIDEIDRIDDADDPQDA